jgi:two-component system sensor histidine kinase KdpD
MNFSKVTSTKIFRYGFAVGGIFVLTLGFELFHGRINSTTIALTFLLFILITATFFGRNPALLSSLASMLCFNFFFIPPVRTWTISDPQNLVAWGAFTITALVAGELSAYARRRAEEAERQTIEIERLYNELQNAFEKASYAEALKQSEKLKSSLLDAVTHDLRTPLTSIKASVTTLLDDQKEKILDETARREFLEIINEENDRLNEFIEGMVGIAKIEANALHLRKSWSAVEEIINSALNRARIRLDSYSVSVAVEEDLPSIFADANSVSEVIFTLLDNAAKYSAKNSNIKITARQAANGAIEIGVEDEGCGIPKDMREKVFVKFFRGGKDDIHTTGSGLGLGLAIARGIIESQGGKIWIEDANEGFVTRVAFQIPVGDEE